MIPILDFPLLVFALSFIVLWLSAFVGDSFFKRVRPFAVDQREDFAIVQQATLTLLSLLIGFSFSMAITRYEQRKSYEEAEANAIGTEYIRAGLLPAADAAEVQGLLSNYLDQRVLFYVTRDSRLLRQIDSNTAQLQNKLWSAVQARAGAQPTPITALAVAGMNDVLNSEGYTQAAWWNRIPFEAWLLLAAIAMVSNLLFGYGALRPSILFVILPLAVSLSLFLIADIDSPRGGLIHVQPQNLTALTRSLHAH